MAKRRIKKTTTAAVDTENDDKVEKVTKRNTRKKADENQVSSAIVEQTKSSDDDEDDDDDACWEEVNLNTTTKALIHENDLLANDILTNISKEPIEIQINVNGNKKAKKQGFDLGAYMLRTYKALQKKLTIEMHKTHLLCWLYHGIYLNKICNNKHLMAFALSMCPRNLQYEVNTSVDVIENVLYTLRTLIKIDDGDGEAKTKSEINLSNTQKAIVNLTCSNSLEYVLVILLFLRCLGIKSRLCVCFDVIHIKDSSSGRSSNTNGKNQEMSESEEEEVEVQVKKRKSNATTADHETKSKKPKTEVKKEVQDENTRRSGLSRKCKEKSTEYKIEDDENVTSNYFSEDEDFQSTKLPITNNVQNQDEHIESLKTTKPIIKLKNKKPLVKNNRAVSVDDDESIDSTTREHEPKFQEYSNYWIEVYLDSEDKWIAIEPLKCKIDCSQYLEKRLGSGTNLLYVCGFDDSNKVKDVTVRYASEWNTRIRKLRIENFDTKFWWEKVLVQYKPLDLELDVRENRILNDLLYLKPLPKSISEFKSHPLYILKRHLLKFQSIHPPDVKPIGQIRGEDIYSRQYLVTLHSKQTWLKYARTVKPYETASKIVKGRLKQSEYKMGIRKNPDLELFGFWQTEAFVPPVAVNGKVPRNEYGNVELFQKSMLPIGCVHLQLQNIHKICRKLGIDYAPAVVGFDQHHGFSHAIYDGWIVCEEFKDVILDAYREEERENELKRVEKEKERIWANWKRLTKSLLIRERLKRKFENQNKTDEDTKIESISEPPPASTRIIRTKNKVTIISANRDEDDENDEERAAPSETKIIKPTKTNKKPKTKPRKSRTRVDYKIDNNSDDDKDQIVDEDDDEDDEFLIDSLKSKRKREIKPASNDNEEESDEYDENSNKKSAGARQKARKPLSKKKIIETKSDYFDDFSSKFSTVTRQTEQKTGLAVLTKPNESFNLSEDDEV